MFARGVGIAVGVVADIAFGDPRRGHPVALFGSGAAALERRTYSDEVRAGVVHTAGLLVSLGVVTAVIERAGRR
ncbi:cobalamin biosynthesis protein, partial [Mycobacterium sp. ITM-2017-0098]